MHCMLLLQFAYDCLYVTVGRDTFYFYFNYETGGRGFSFFSNEQNKLGMI